MYSLTPGYRVPAVQRGLSPIETMLTKANAGVGGAVLLSAMSTPPPGWTFGVVGAAAALLNVSAGRRSLARWAAVGYRHLRERTAPAGVFARPGATATWALYPEHGVMQDGHRRVAFHEALSRALSFTGSQAASAGIQVHLSHHAVVGDYTEHTQTLSVHVPKGLVGQSDRLLETLAGEFASLGVLTPITPEPVPLVASRGPGWVALEDGRFAATARIASWPEESGGDLMPKLLLGQDCDRSLSVLYRPLPAGQSRRSARWQRAASEAFTTDQIKRDAHDLVSGATHGALVQGATLVDLDAYLTVWGASAVSVTEARWQAALAADRHRVQLDWLSGQQHRAHVMTTPHGASTQKGAIL